MKKEEVTEYYPERRKKMPPDVTNKPTTVRFELWAVLAFLVALTGICIGYLFNSQADSKVAHNVLSERVVKVETNYTHIVTGIERLEKSQKEMMELLIKQKRAKGE